MKSLIDGTRTLTHKAGRHPRASWGYNQNGTLLGVIPDKMKNEVHFMNTDGDPGSQFSTKGLSKKRNKCLRKKF